MELGHDLPFEDPFESTERWTVNPFGTDTATTGGWEIGAPQGSSWNGVVVQPAHAAEGQRAMITGLTSLATAFSNDVDEGLTSTISPPFHMPADELIDFSFDSYRHGKFFIDVPDHRTFERRYAQRFDVLIQDLLEREQRAIIFISAVVSFDSKRKVSEPFRHLVDLELT